MASEVGTIGSKEELLRVLVRNSEGRVFDERRRLKFEGWLELKSCENPRHTYLNHYRIKPINYLREGMFISPAAKLRTPPEIEVARRQAERNKPTGCGTMLLYIYLGVSALAALFLLIANQFKR